MLQDLTQRERQIIAALCEGKCNKLIARTLNISEGTVKVHLVNICAKLGVQGRGRTALVAMALQEARQAIELAAL
jgi:two-component system, NarL family, nitrate/nitrite response regulator NarL